MIISTPKAKTYLLLIMLVTLASILVILIPRVIPLGVDFYVTFLPVGRDVLGGRFPYENITFFNPPWLLVMLVPLALLPDGLAWGIFVILGITGYLVALRRLGASWPELVLLMLSPFVWYGIYYGNIDWLVLLGASLTPTWGIWFLVLKPQMSIVLGGLWLIRAWPKRILIEFGPVCLGLGLSFVLGLWRMPERAKMYWSLDIWPWGIPVGLVFTWLAWRRQDTRLALAAGPFLSPYIAIQSWLLVLLPMIGRRYWLPAGVTLGWLYILYMLLIK